MSDRLRTYAQLCSDLSVFDPGEDFGPLQRWLADRDAKLTLAAFPSDPPRALVQIIVRGAVLHNQDEQLAVAVAELLERVERTDP